MVGVGDGRPRSANTLLQVFSGEVAQVYQNQTLLKVEMEEFLSQVPAKGVVLSFDKPASVATGMYLRYQVFIF